MSAHIRTFGHACRQERTEGVFLRCRLRPNSVDPTAACRAERAGGPANIQRSAVSYLDRALLAQAEPKFPVATERELGTLAEALDALMSGQIMAAIYIIGQRFRAVEELRSILNHGLIPGGVSLKTGRHAVFFTVVNPMDNQDGPGETQCDLSQARIAPYKSTWKHFQDTVFWCNLKLAQQRGLQLYQTTPNAVILYDKNQDHLGNHNKMRRAAGKTEATL